MKIYKAYLLVAGFCFSLTAMAQEDDFGIWTSVGATKKITKDFGITGELEYRTRNDSKTTERWSGELSMNYKLAPYLKLEGGYVYIYYNHPSEFTSKGNYIPEYWSPRHRLYFGAAGSYKTNRWTFSLRERYQYTYRTSLTVPKYSDTSKTEQKSDEEISGKSTSILRSRLQVEYDIKGSPFKPFASCELFNLISDGMKNDKTRWTIGTDFALNKSNSIELYYRYQKQADDDEANGHILGIGYSIKF